MVWGTVAIMLSLWTLGYFVGHVGGSVHAFLAMAFIFFVYGIINVMLNRKKYVTKRRGPGEGSPETSPTLVG